MTNVTAPSEPPMTGWIFPDPMEADEDIVAVGADLEPGTVLAAYRLGLFPMPMTEVEGMSWWSPVRRGILPIKGLRVTRSMRQSAKHFDVTVDKTFDEVVARCANPNRPGGWIDRDIAKAYAPLQLGWAHSVEVWREGELVGGLYGLAIGGCSPASRCSTSSATRRRSRSCTSWTCSTTATGADSSTCSGPRRTS